MRHYKFATLCAAAMLLAGLVLTGCGTEDANAPIRIRIWHQKAPSERALFDDFVARFNADHPDIVVETLFKSTEELRNLFVTAAVGGQGPELVYGPADNVGLLVLTESIMPITRLFGPEVLSQYTDDGLVVWRDSTWLLGDQVGNHLTLVYNKALVPEPPDTFEEMIAMGPSLTRDEDGDGRPDRYTLTFGFTEPFFFVPFLTGFGGGMMDESGKPTLDTEATVKALQFVIDLRDKYALLPRESDYDVAETLFKEGRVAMIINGPWAWSGYQDAGVDIGLAPIPKIPETGEWCRPMSSTRGFSVNVNLPSEKYDAVREVLLYLTGEEVQVEMAKRLVTTPVRYDALGDPSTASNPLFAASLRQIELSVPMPLHPALRQIWDGARGPYQLVMSGAISPEEGARRMQEQSEKLIHDTFL